MNKNKNGFSIIELLIAVAILSVVLLGVLSGVAAGIVAISSNENRTKAMLISKNVLNDFILDKMRGIDLKDRQIEEYPGFTYDRTITRFEHELFGPLDANKVEFIIRWEERGKPRDYKLVYIYPQQR